MSWKIGFSEVRPRADDYRQGNNDTECRRRLKPSRIVPAPFIRNMLGHVSDCTTVLPAEAEALDKAQEENNYGCRYANLSIRRNHTDDGGREPHSSQRHNERIFSAYLIAQPAEHECAQRPDQ